MRVWDWEERMYDYQDIPVGDILISDGGGVHLRVLSELGKPQWRMVSDQTFRELIRIKDDDREYLRKSFRLPRELEVSL